MFIESLEQSFVTPYMLEDIITRWKSIGKPLFIHPKDFKDKILIGLESEIKLNYLKWLTQGNEIDIFEIMSMLIIYCRCELTERLRFLFVLFCYNPQLEMDKNELDFMFGKLCCTISSTF